MDVEPLEHYHGTRRRMRRPVAGSLADPLESWLDVVEPSEVPGWVWVVVGATAGGCAIVAAGAAVLIYWVDRLFNN